MQSTARLAVLDSAAEANIAQNKYAGKFSRQLEKTIDAILAEEEF
jgi:hypothetical protein